MTPIDAEGRLFGRLNVVDAAIGGFLLLLIPLAVASVLLFRAPSPEITSVEPAPLTITEDRAAQGSTLGGKIKVRGRGLRPVLRAEIGERPAIAFIFEDPTSADVLFGDLPPGTHDLVLKDGVQEVARARGAVTIPERPALGASRLRAVGNFVELTEAAARELKTGSKHPSDGEPEVEILKLGDAEPARYTVNTSSEASIPNRWHRPGVVAIRCQLPLFAPRECRTSSALLDVGNVIAMPGSAGALRFLIDEVQPDREPLQTNVRVRFLAYPSVTDLVRVGDRDREQWAIDGRGAIVRSIESRRLVAGQVTVSAPPRATGVAADVQATDQVVAIDLVLSLGIDPERDGWRYRADLIRAGGPFTFTTRTYTIRGIVLSLGTLPSAAGAGPGESR